MEQNSHVVTPADGLEELREQIALVQVLDLDQHSHAYEQIHIKLEEALRSIDGK
jgi:hypothetical protein